ncbi:hypothetical protein E2C01_069061 [Portunus trituberculatus]|uniref:Uncharacterized protein n=1 Tax=Portunus trituberculatus TaxID=210409 RepID=A0A5B7HYD9_PORTR|nr:hypothetical protein [Portunus trituberculatus]
MATQVDKTMLIGPEASQPHCCKKGAKTIIKQVQDSTKEVE